MPAAIRRSVLNALGQRLTLTWTSGMLTALQDTAGKSHLALLRDDE